MIISMSSFIGIPHLSSFAFCPLGPRTGSDANAM
jgi:hypothetical protein